VSPNIVIDPQTLPDTANRFGKVRIAHRRNIAQRGHRRLGDITPERATRSGRRAPKITQWDPPTFDNTPPADSPPTLTKGKSRPSDPKAHDVTCHPIRRQEYLTHHTSHIYHGCILCSDKTTRDSECYTISAFASYFIVGTRMVSKKCSEVCSWKRLTLGRIINALLVSRET